MKSKVKNTKNLKIRVTPKQQHCIENIAKEKGTTLSEIMRIALFTNSAQNKYAIRIHNELIKNQIYNHINAMPISKNTKELIFKELNEIE